MSSVNRVLLLIAVFSLALLPACGGGGSHINPTPPPTGGFSLSSLNGTYVFSTSGLDNSNNVLTMVGTFAANGSGGITGGIVDMNDSGFTSGPVMGLAITGGKYSVTSDGRGQATLSANTPFGRSIGVDFVLSTNSHGSITEFDANGSGSGSLDLQSAVTQAQLAGSYAFNLSGISTSGSLATVGSFMLDSSGNITAGVQDINTAGAFTSFPLSGKVTVGAPGTATLTTAGALGSIGFDIYTVDSTHLKFIEVAGSALLSGDAFTQQGAALPTTATTYAFVMSGGTSTPLAVGGLLAIDGKGNVSGVGVDINNAGTVTSSTITGGSYASPSGSVGGRTVFTLSGFSVGTTLVAYPTAGAGLQILQIDGLNLLDGTALAQAGPTPSLQASQGYAIGLSAVNSSSEEDDIAEFTTSNGSFSGIIDINDQGSTSTPQPFRGSYVLDSPATGRGELTTTSSSGFDGVFYAVDSSTLLFLETDSSQIGTGIFELQNASAKPGSASPHALVVPRAVRGSLRRQDK
jgi:hypothetical protein